MRIAFEGKESDLLQRSGAMIVTILIVDGDRDIRMSLACALALAEAPARTVITAPNGDAALDILDAEETPEVDLLVTEIIMPGLHGFALARMARLRHPRIKILYLTDVGDKDLALQDKYDRLGKVLVKPILPHDFCKEVEAALSPAVN